MTSEGSQLAVAVVVLLLGISLALAGASFEVKQGGNVHWIVWATVFVGSVLGGAFLSRRGAPITDRRVELRTMELSASVFHPSTRGRPARALGYRAARWVAPPVSGRWTVILMLLCMAVAAVVLPRALQLPRWLEWEAVLLTWWLAWGGVLSVLLYRGWRLSDDHVLGSPRAPWSYRRKSGAGDAAGDGCADGCLDPGCADLGTGLEVLVGFALVGSVLLASWVIAEIALPALFFLLYATVRGGLARVANDRHGCEGRPLASIGWGFLWASLYVGVLALAVFGLHALRG